jgi:hypothetical protein
VCVHGGAAQLGVWHDAVGDLHEGATTFDAGAEGEGGKGGLDRGEIGGGESGAEQFGGESAVVGSGVHMQKVEALAQGAGRSGFAGGGAAIYSDD